METEQRITFNANFDEIFMEVNYLYSNKFCAQHLYFHRQFKVKLNKFWEKTKTNKKYCLFALMPISLTSVCCIFVVWLSYWYIYICMRACHDQWKKKEMKMETQCFSQCFNFVFVCAKSAYIQHQLLCALVFFCSALLLFS